MIDPGSQPSVVYFKLLLFLLTYCIREKILPDDPVAELEDDEVRDEP